MPGQYILPLVLAVPLLGALFVMCTPKTESSLHRGLGLAFSTIAFVISLIGLKFFNAKSDAFQLVFDVEWIPGLGAHFKVGVDGMSIFLVILTTFLMPLTILGTGKAVEKHSREFMASMLVLETGMLGAFVALDLFLFYVSWEVMLIPMYLLIGIWGGQRRLYAAIKFVIYTMVGSLLMLVAIFYVYVQAGSVLPGGYTTDLTKILEVALPYDAQVWCFAAFALAFAIKVPLFPLHTWLPDAHVEAPTAGSVILAGVLLKFGIYGFLRFGMPMFPHGAAVWAPLLAVLSVIGIIYGAFVAFAQDDVKKLVAYSSVSHLGFCMLGVLSLTALGVSGSIYAMLSHGLTTGGLFLGIGVLYERRHTRRLAEYGGLWKQMPVFSGLFLIVVMGSAGLPALSGFVGEFLTIFGTFIGGATLPQGYSIPSPRILGALAATGVVLGAVYLLFMYQKVFFGKLDKARNGKLPDLRTHELITFVILAIAIFLGGIFPNPLLTVMEPSVQKFVRDYGRRVGEPDGPPHIYGALPAPGAPAVDAIQDAAGQAGQPAPGQPGAGQPVPGQPVPGQPVPGQPVPGQPVPGQPVPGQGGQPVPGQGGQPAPGQPGAGQPGAGQPVPGQGGQPAPGQPIPGQAGQPGPGQPVAGRPGGGQPAPGQPMPGQAGQPGAGQPGPGQPAAAGARQPGQPPAAGARQPGQPPAAGARQPGQPPAAGARQPGQPPAAGARQPGQPPAAGARQPGQSPTRQPTTRAAGGNR